MYFGGTKVVKFYFFTLLKMFKAYFCVLYFIQSKCLFSEKSQILRVAVVSILDSTNVLG